MNRVKKMVMVLTIMAVSAGALFANGARENVDRTNGTWQQGIRRSASEQLTMQGTLIEQDGQLLFSSEGKLYTISAPGYPRSGFSPAPGTIMTVEASLQEALADCPVDSEGHLVVTAADIDGEHFEFSTAGGRQNMASRRAGAGAGTGAGRGPRGNGGGGYRAN